MNSPYTSLPPLTGSVDHCQGSARNTLSAVLTLTAVVEVAVPTLSGSIRIRNGTMEFEDETMINISVAEHQKVK